MSESHPCPTHTSKLGLTQLSTKISDIQHLVTLPFSSSPRAVTYNIPRIASPSAQSPLRLSPNVASAARTFARISSAPASSALFESTTASARPSGLGFIRDDALLSSPTLTPPKTSVNSSRTFARSRTNAPASAKSHGTALEILMSNNQLVKCVAFCEIAFADRRLPSALFELSNLTVLSLRK